MKCPFENPEFQININDPCPVCGMLGNFTDEDKCVDNKENKKSSN